MIEMQPRSCWVCQGDAVWCQDTATTLIMGHEAQDILWVSMTPPLQIRSQSSFTALSPKQAQTVLGQEADIVVFDATTGCDPDALGAVGGMIRAGGVLILLFAEEEHPLLWQQHLETALANTSIWIRPSDTLPTLTIHAQSADHESARYRTEDQRTAVTAIEKVALGRRRRPLVLTSDRGRGKSAALGIAAAHLLRAGKQRVVVTGPSLASVETVFKHAAELLPTAVIKRGSITWETRRLEFVAADALLAEKNPIDLVLVDEAAAIPSPMLARYIKQFSRVVLSTTLHGYEGSGRGFAIRFQQLLADQCPDYQQYDLVTPIRWIPNDPLENILFDALLLDATPAGVGISAEINPENCEIMRIERKTLAEDKVMLRSLFGLMVTAHYRTRPSDLRILLDHPAVSVWVMRYQGKVVAGAWSIDEGVLDKNLAQDIHAGERRLKGHLLPQTLIHHAGNLDAAGLRYQRVMRIAVHSELQDRGLGTALLQAMTEAYQKQGIDMMGASFGAETSLLHFWSEAGFSPVRLGTKQNDCSGERAVVMLSAFSRKAEKVLTQAQTRFEKQWYYLLSFTFHHLSAEIALTISLQLTKPSKVVSQYDRQDVQAFAHGQRDFESSQYALSQWLPRAKPKIKKLTAQQRQALIMAVLQGRTWSDMAQELGVNGKADVVTVLRESVRQLLA